MAEDVLTMRARLLDEASGALSQLKRNLHETGKGVELAKPRKEFSELQDKVKGLAGEFSGGLIPAMGKFSLSTAGVVLGAGAVAAALYGLGRQLSDFANKRADLKFAAQDMGVTVAQLKAFEKAASEVRIDPGSAQQALQTFAKNAEDFKLRIGALREELYNLGAGDVVEAIGRAATPVDALRIAFERMEELQRRNPVLARRFAETMFGTAAVARLNWEEFQKYNRELELSGKYSADAMAKSEAFRKEWENLERALTGLKERALTPLFPAFTKGLEGVNSLIDKTKAGIEWLSQHMPGWGDAAPGDRAPNLSARGGANQRERGDDIRRNSRSFWDWLSSSQNQRPRASQQSFGGDAGGLLHRTSFGDIGAGRDDVEEPIYSAMLRALRDWSQSIALGGAGAGGGGGAMLASFGGSAGAAGSRIGGGQSFGGGGFANLGPGGGAGAGGGRSRVGGFGQGTPGVGPTKLGKGDDPRGHEQFIRETAKKYGIDPDTAVAVAKSEGLRDFSGDKGTSFGAFQLHTGGGLGDEFKKETGLDPSDPKNERATIDYALKNVGRTGWGPYHGAARTGIGPRAGIGMPSLPELGGASAGGIDPHRMDPMAPAGAGVTREPLAEVRTSRGRTFKVAAWSRENFQRFVDNYEKAGGDLGPDTGTLGTRPGNRSYHPLGRAIDVNQIGYGVRSRKGGTLPREMEDKLAEDAGLWPGSRFGDAGHFEARNRALVEAKQSQWARERMNAAIGGQQNVKAEGTVNVNVTAPSGTKVNADSEGLFQSTRVQRYKQMPETGLDGGAQ